MVTDRMWPSVVTLALISASAFPQRGRESLGQARIGAGERVFLRASPSAPGTSPGSVPSQGVSLMEQQAGAAPVTVEVCAQGAWLHLLGGQACA